MMDPRQQLAVMNMMLCGLLLCYSLEWVAKAVYTLAGLVLQNQF